MTKIDKMKSEIEEIRCKIGDMALAELMTNLISAQKPLYPNIVVLLELAIICPLNNATVERLLSFMRLVKTKLRSQLRDDTLNKVLRIKTESPDHLEEYQLEALVDSFGEYARSLTKSGEIRIRI